MSQFGLTVDRLGPGALCIRLRGDLDYEHVYVFDEELRRVEAADPEATIVLNLSELSFLDSTGMAALMAARRRAARTHRRIVVVQGGPSIRRIMRLVGMEDAFEIVHATPPELLTAADGAEPTPT